MIRALQIHPNDARTHFAAALFMTYNGLTEGSIRFFERTIELDPFFLPPYNLVAMDLLFLGRSDEAGRRLRESAEIEPGNFSNLRGQTMLAILNNELGRAEELLEQMTEGRPGTAPEVQAMFHAARGEKERALSFAKSSYVYALLGLDDDAIEALRAETEQGWLSYLQLLHNPIYAGLTDDPRFQALVEKHRVPYEELMGKYGALVAMIAEGNRE